MPSLGGLTKAIAHQALLEVCHSKKIPLILFSVADSPPVSPFPHSLNVPYFSGCFLPLCCGPFAVSASSAPFLVLEFPQSSRLRWLLPPGTLSRHLLNRKYTNDSQTHWLPWPLLWTPDPHIHLPTWWIHLSISQVLSTWYIKSNFHFFRKPRALSVFPTSIDEPSM